MSVRIFIVSGFITLFCFACKKDKGVLAKEAPSATVNYRQKFIGNYTGAVCISSQTCFTGPSNSYTWSPVDTLSISAGFIKNVLPHLTNDSLLIIENSYFKLKVNGIAHTFVQGPPVNHDPSYYTVAFRNDSLFIRYKKLMSFQSTGNSNNSSIFWKYTDFAGFKN